MVPLPPAVSLFIFCLSSRRDRSIVLRLRPPVCHVFEAVLPLLRSRKCQHLRPEAGGWQEEGAFFIFGTSGDAPVPRNLRKQFRFGRFFFCFWPVRDNFVAFLPVACPVCQPEIFQCGGVATFGHGYFMIHGFAEGVGVF